MYLLDTCVFLWASFEPAKLSSSAIDALSEGDELHLSAASAWEIAIKFAQDRLPLPASPERFVPEAAGLLGAQELAVRSAHAFKAGALPRHHPDPFDRLLIAQAIAEHLTIITPDPAFKKYKASVLW